MWFVLTTKTTKWSSKGFVPPARFKHDQFSTKDVVVFATRNIHTIPPLDHDLKIEFFHRCALQAPSLLSLPQPPSPRLSSSHAV